MSVSWTSGLNPEQILAVRHSEGPLLILAGAGSGKTTVLVSRTGQILMDKKAKPEEILVLTFTNKAARELKERVSQKLGAKSKKIWAGTFHGFGLQVLKENYKKAGLPQRFGLLDATDSRNVIKELLKSKKHFAKQDFDSDILFNVMSDLRAGKTLSPSISEEYREMADWLLPSYISRMHSLGVVDFDGLLLNPLKLFKDYPELAEKYQKKYKYLMVDEFQDTNKIQLELVMAICNSQQNIAVVGDDDQSIYGWRGAEIQNILSFPKLFKKCEVVRLETNYRSTPQILNAANSIIDQNEQRHKKILRPKDSAEKGSLPEIFMYDNEEEECDEIIQQIFYFNKQGFKNKNIAVLFRSNSQGALLEGALRRNNIDYDITGGPALIDRKEVRDALAYVRSALAPHDVSVRRILNTPARGIGDTTIHKIIDYQSQHNTSFIQALKSWSQVGLIPKTGLKINQFFELLEQLKQVLLQPTSESYSVILPRFFMQIGYRELVFNSYKDKGVAQRKWMLIEIVGKILDGFINKGGRTQKVIREFLEALELRDVDVNKEEEKNHVQLLTLHASKGLEFPVVVLMGLDEGILPHETLGSDISEERRLFYVGVTRAQKKLIITRAKKRKRYGRWREVSISRFLCEIPQELVRTYEGGSRPLKEGERKSLLDDLYKKLDAKIDAGQNL